MSATNLIRLRAAEEECQQRPPLLSCDDMNMAFRSQLFLTPTDHLALRGQAMTNRFENSFTRLNPEDSARLRRVQVVRPNRVHRVLEYVLFGVVAVLLGVGGIALYTANSPSFRQAPNSLSEGIRNDRINLLLLGVAGQRKVGGGNDLADAILLVSIKPSTHQVALISVPRDLYVNMGSYGTHRINRTNEIGEQSGYPGGGAALAMNTVASVFHQPVHAFVRLDFTAFEKIIDDLGGVDINVQRPFYDYLFKDGFTKGMQHMNGERALKYARYRYINGPEGDNFARELRQQQVINAVRQKLSRRGPQEVMRVATSLATLSRYTDTNLTTPQMAWLYNKFHDLQPSQVRHVSLKPYMEIFNINTLADAGEAVRPRDGNFFAVQKLTADIFSDMQQVGTPDAIRVADDSASAPKAVTPIRLSAARIR